MLTRTPLPAILYILGAALLAAIGPFLFHLGSKSGKDGAVGFLTNPYILAGMVVYLIVMGLFTHAFRLGGTVRVLYPLYATTFIWAALMAWAFHGQPIQPVHILGMLLLILGIACMSW